MWWPNKVRAAAVTGLAVCNGVNGVEVINLPLSAATSASVPIPAEFNSHIVTTQTAVLSIAERAHELLTPFGQAVREVFPSATVKLASDASGEEAHWIFSVEYHLGADIELTPDLLAKDDRVFDAYMHLVDDPAGPDFRSQYGFSRWFA